MSTLLADAGGGGVTLTRPHTRDLYFYILRIHKFYPPCQAHRTIGKQAPKYFHQVKPLHNITHTPVRVCQLFYAQVIP